MSDLRIPKNRIEMRRLGEILVDELIRNYEVRDVTHTLHLMLDLADYDDEDLTEMIELLQKLSTIKKID